jgi:hypothetical protein
MTSSSSMKAKILIRPLHLGHVKGSTSNIFWINPPEADKSGPV